MTQSSQSPGKGRIPPGFIEEVLARTDIVDVIDSRVPLRKAGREYTACCPFHTEKTPSFTVSPDKQFYYCFGCGAHGSALGFLMEFDRLNFVEAVEELASRAGLQVPREESAGKTAPSQDLYVVLEECARFYRNQLKQHPQAQVAVDYLKRRGLTGEIAQRFELGYAPPAWDNLAAGLGNDARTLQQLFKAGMLIERSKNQYYDRFRHRVMFPIRDSRGRMIGFGGRVLEGDEGAKYLNSPETPVFHKGRELYGLHQVKQAHREPARILVVEGYMDVVALAQFGVDYAVATLGTATTPEHLERLFRLTSEVVFCFDGDAAGQRAAWRALERTMPVLSDGRKIGFVFLPQGEDPDSLVRKEGKEQFEGRIANSLPLSSYFFAAITEQADTGSIEGRAQLVNSAKKLINTLPEGALKHMMIDRLAQLTRMDTQELTGLVAPNKAAGMRRTPPVTAGAKRTSAPSPVRTAIALLLKQPELATQVTQHRELADPALKGSQLLAKLVEILRERPHMHFGALLEIWEDPDEKRQLVKIAQWPVPVPDDGISAEFIGAVERIRHQSRELRTDHLLQKAQLGALQPDEQSELQRLLRRD